MHPPRAIVLSLRCLTCLGCYDVEIAIPTAEDVPLLADCPTCQTPTRREVLAWRWRWGG